ncbi:hypothetical protein M3Y98_00629700 [Aphelenchoides besseyi]|nr:hypothetical protein M3Y98_00629700 [Aphelenchoides besseyi]KAI6208463.1 hypothetical protein M3Y96_00118000 [Aphelenchoides besseyi]
MTTEVVHPIDMPVAAPISDDPAIEAAIVSNGVSIESNGNGQPSANGQPTANGAENGQAKKQEVAKDPRADPAEWLIAKGKTHVHTAAFQVAKWVIDAAYAEGEEKPQLPANGQLTRSQFVNLFKDGQIFGKLANRLKPGSVEEPKESAESKDIQKANINAFNAVAKEHLSEDKVFNSDDLEKGKSEFAKIFNTLFFLAEQAQEKFQIAGINVEQFIEGMEKVVPKSLAEKIRDAVTGFFSRKKSLNSIFKVDAKAKTEQPAVNTEQPPAITEPAPTTTVEVVEEKKEEIVPVAPVN